MDQAFLNRLSVDTEDLKAAGLFKAERVIRSQQQADIQIADGSEVVNFCANNYLGLANHPALIEAAHSALDRYGYGMASVRFICGTQRSPSTHICATRAFKIEADGVYD